MSTGGFKGGVEVGPSSGRAPLDTHMLQSRRRSGDVVCTIGSGAGGKLLPTGLVPEVSPTVPWRADELVKASAGVGFASVDDIESWAEAFVDEYPFAHFKFHSPPHHHHRHSYYSRAVIMLIRVKLMMQRPGVKPPFQNKKMWIRVK